MKPLAPSDVSGEERREGERRDGERARLVGDRPVAGREREQPAAEAPRDDADGRPADDRQQRLVQQRRVRRALDGDGGRQREHDDRDAHAVVQPGLDVEAAPHAAGDPLVGDDGSAQRGVGRRQQRGEQHAEPDLKAAKQRERGEDPGTDRERQADAEQAVGEPLLRPRAAAARSSRRRRTGSARARAPPARGRHRPPVSLRSAGDRSAPPASPVTTPPAGEDERRRDRAAFEPPGHERVREQEGGEDRGDDHRADHSPRGRTASGKVGLTVRQVSPEARLVHRRKHPDRAAPRLRARGVGGRPAARAVQAAARECPVHWTDRITEYPKEAGFWSVTTADGVHAVSRDWQTYSSERRRHHRADRTRSCRSS